MHKPDPCPCNGCVAPDRHIGCHADCHKGYPAWADRQKQRNKERYLDGEHAVYINAVRYRFRRYRGWRNGKDGKW